MAWMWKVNKQMSKTRCVISVLYNVFTSIGRLASNTTLPPEVSTYLVIVKFSILANRLVPVCVQCLSILGSKRALEQPSYRQTGHTSTTQAPPPQRKQDWRCRCIGNRVSAKKRWCDRGTEPYHIPESVLSISRPRQLRTCAISNSFLDYLPAADRKGIKGKGSGIFIVPQPSS